MTIRRRLMLWYSVALALALGAIAGTIYYEIFVEHPNVDLSWRLKAVGESPEEELAEALVFAGIPVAVLSLAVAWVLIRRAFAPVVRLKHAAERLPKVERQLQQWKERDGAHVAKLAEVRERMRRAERAAALSQEHLIATEAKLDVVEAALGVLDRRTRRPL